MMITSSSSSGQQTEAATSSRGKPTWGLLQGRHTNNHAFVSPAKGVKKK
jgi:hypothetical protein